MGTLIIQEIPQCSLVESENKTVEPTSLLDAFRSMNLCDQEKYLNLHNRFNNITDFDENSQLTLNELMDENNQNDEIIEKATEIYGIYKTNTFPGGVFLQISRFNHSCAPNAEIVWRTEESKASEIRAVSKIKLGDEITINYNITHIVMQNLKTRQGSIKIPDFFIDIPKWLVSLHKFTRYPGIHCPALGSSVIHSSSLRSNVSRSVSSKS